MATTSLTYNHKGQLHEPHYIGSTAMNPFIHKSLPTVLYAISTSLLKNPFNELRLFFSVNLCHFLFYFEWIIHCAINLLAPKHHSFNFRDL